VWAFPPPALVEKLLKSMRRRREGERPGILYLCTTERIFGRLRNHWQGEAILRKKHLKVELPPGEAVATSPFQVWELRW
jgi:hypothetical protein